MLSGLNENRLKPYSITQYFSFHKKEAGHGKIVNKPTLLITIKSRMATEVSENEILQCFLKVLKKIVPINFDERKIE